MFALAVVPQPADAAGWGTIKGKFVVDGSRADAAPIDASKDAYLRRASSGRPFDRRRRQGQSGERGRVPACRARQDKVEVHPDYDAAKDEPAVLDNKGCSFHPHISLVRTGQPFVIKNSDPVGHNTKYESA